MAENIMTGYPSIDRPWLNYYSKDAITKDIPETKLYDYIYECNKGYEGNLCISYWGKKITYKVFFREIDKVAKSFIALGVKTGDVVSIVAPTTPESIYCVYALNRLGAIANLIDPRLSEENIREKITYSKYIIALDLIYKKMRSAINESQVVVFFSIAESFPGYMKILYKIKGNSEYDKKAVIGWKAFIESGNRVVDVIDVPYQKNEVVVMVSTSGTTGKSKLAQLTNDNINAVAWQYEYAGYGKHYGETFLNIMPLFLAYGFVSGIHMPLALGFKIVITF